MLRGVLFQCFAVAVRSAPTHRAVVAAGDNRKPRRSRALRERRDLQYASQYSCVMFGVHFPTIFRRLNLGAPLDRDEIKPNSGETLQKISRRGWVRTQVPRVLVHSMRYRPSCPADPQTKPCRRAHTARLTRHRPGIRGQSGAHGAQPEAVAKPIPIPAAAHRQSTRKSPQLPVILRARRWRGGMTIPRR